MQRVPFCLFHGRHQSPRRFEDCATFALLRPLQHLIEVHTRKGFYTEPQGFTWYKPGEDQHPGVRHAQLEEFQEHVKFFSSLCGPVWLLGFGEGGKVALDLTYRLASSKKKQPIAGVIAYSPSFYTEVKEQTLPPIKSHFPVLLVGSPQDDTIPWSTSQRWLALFPQTQVFTHNKGHQLCPIPEVTHTLTNYLKDLSLPQ